MYKKRNMGLIILISAVFCTIIAIAPVNACGPDGPPSIVDEHSGIYYHKSNQYKVNWITYSYSHSKHKDNKREIYLEYKIVNKNSKIVKGYGTIVLEKISKNKLKISETYSTSEKDRITYKKTKLNAKNYYWDVYRTKLLKTIKKPMTVITYYIDNGSTDYKKFNESNSLFHRNVKNKLKWKTYSYSDSSRITIDLNYISQFYGGTSFNYGTVKIKKVGKNKLKIISRGLEKVNGTSIKNTNQYVKTKLSPKKYYTKVYKSKMVKNYLKVNKKSNKNNISNNNTNPPNPKISSLPAPCS